ncbi:hypothetical protein [Paraburkholderia bryophila]|uniref:Uncharacterized protein n=1 Tax=Paraburkholderia bryophila TaxID=420952 RepID=A0A7Y9W3A7_9BURK|nr:hypothetical protein [Paraburkholderia bryophila]NYH13454.1 hypothetical protein [Paraburkholderia bryophila]
MVNDLSPICKALIALLASQTSVLTITDINGKLDEADVDAVRAELRMLVRADLVRQGVRTNDSRIVYWFATASIDTAETDRDATLADVGEAAEPRIVFFCGDSESLKNNTSNRRYLTFEPTAPGLLKRADEHMRARAGHVR